MESIEQGQEGATADRFNTSVRSTLLGLIPSIVVNGVLPFVLYQVLTGRGVPVLTALLLTSIFPLAGIAFGWMRRGSLDAIGLISLIFIAASFISGNPRFYLVKESFGTGAFGLAMLISLAFPRPIMFYLSRQGATGGSPEAVARWNGLWTTAPMFRHMLRVMTVVWGFGLVTEAAVRVVLALVAPPSVVLAVGQVMAYVVIAVLLLWTFSYGRSVQRRGEALRARAQGTPVAEGRSTSR
jgi:hypothetical protein